VQATIPTVTVIGGQMEYDGYALNHLSCYAWIPEVSLDELDRTYIHMMLDF